MPTWLKGGLIGISIPIILAIISFMVMHLFFQNNNHFFAATTTFVKVIIFFIIGSLIGLGMQKGNWAIIGGLIGLILALIFIEKIIWIVDLISPGYCYENMICSIFIIPVVIIAALIGFIMRKTIQKPSPFGTGS